MSNYLYQHYKGKYRVLADYDLETHDFPRDDKGNIDQEFNDYYIAGRKGVQIRHSNRDILGCYIFGTGISHNILNAIYEKELHKKPPTKIETVVNKLIEADIIKEVTYYDKEILFTFKAEHLNDWAKIFKLKTSGANISPLSSKNLPKSDYTINKDDEKDYNELMSKLTKSQKMIVAKKAVATLSNKFTKKQKMEMKKLNMKPKQYIHYIGKWDKLLSEMKKIISELE